MDQNELYGDAMPCIQFAMDRSESIQCPRVLNCPYGGRHAERPETPDERDVELVHHVPSFLGSSPSVRENHCICCISSGIKWG